MTLELSRLTIGACRALGLPLLLIAAWPAEARPLLSLVAPGETVELSLEDLRALPQMVLTTGNDYTDQAMTYTGPLVRDTLAIADLDDAETVRFVALNDYFIDIPVEDFRVYDAILALDADGERLSRRDKGPIWLMYPIDDHPELAGPRINARLIWQVVRIEAR